MCGYNMGGLGMHRRGLRHERENASDTEGNTADQRWDTLREQCYRFARGQLLQHRSCLSVQHRQHFLERMGRLGRL